MLGDDEDKSQHDEIQNEMRDAAWDDDAERLNEALKDPHTDPNFQDDGGQSLLHMCAFWGSTKCAEALIAVGADLTSKNVASFTPLDVAVHWGKEAVANVLRQSGGHSVCERRLATIHTKYQDATAKLAFEIEKHEEDIAKLDDAVKVQIVLRKKQNELQRQLHLRDRKITDLEQQVRQEIALRKTAKQDGDTAREIAEKTLESYRLAKDAQLRAEEAEKSMRVSLKTSLEKQESLQHTLSENKEQLTAMENAVRETESRAAMSLAVRDLLVRVLEKREKEKQSLAKTLAEKQQFIGYMEKQLGKAAWTFEQRQMRLHKAKVQLDDIGESEQRVYFRKMAEDFSLRVRAEHQYEMTALQRSLDEEVKETELERRRRLNLLEQGFQKDFVSTIRNFSQAHKEVWGRVETGKPWFETSGPAPVSFGIGGNRAPDSSSSDHSSSQKLNPIAPSQQRPLSVESSKETAKKLWQRMDEMVFESDSQNHAKRKKIPDLANKFSPPKSKKPSKRPQSQQSRTLPKDLGMAHSYLDNALPIRKD